MKLPSLIDTPLLQLSPRDYWTARDAFMHLLALGTTGSGKSSGTLKHCILSALSGGFGMLYCTAKPEDADAFQDYCARTNHLSSLINWKPGTGRGIEVDFDGEGLFPAAQHPEVDCVVYKFAKAGAQIVVADNRQEEALLRRSVDSIYFSLSADPHHVALQCRTKETIIQFQTSTN